ncbi:MAG: hypothetical protein MJD61_04635 [Proteobacteria bacterium]|nr:hypothetical protein [Pseudomonadota bacterium]
MKGRLQSASALFDERTDESGGSDWRRRAVELSVKLLVPAAVAIALVSVLVGERIDVAHDLHVVAASHVLAGQPLPVRVLVYGNLRAVQGPKLLSAPVQVELETPTGLLLARADLRPSALGSMEGALEVPPAAGGPMRLRASTVLHGQRVRSEKDIHVGSTRAARRDLVARPVGPLQTLALGPVHVVAGDPPADLDLRVGGGTCVPERPCELLIHVGMPAASVRLEPTASVSPVREQPGAATTSGLVTLTAITHGPEAHTQLLAYRSGALVARRAVRLPVALAVASMRLQQAVSDAPARPEVTVGSDADALIIEAFRDGCWLRSGVLVEPRQPLPFEPLEAGIWRLQARADPFASSTAAVRFLYVREPGETRMQSLSALARFGLEQDARDPFARRLSVNPGAFAEEDLARVAGFVFARGEPHIMPQPAAASGYASAVARLSEQRAQLRLFALVSLVLSGVALALVLARRGLHAASEARRILADAGVRAAQGRLRKLRMTLTVLASVAAILLAFSAIVIYVLARSQAYG